MERRATPPAPLPFPDRRRRTLDETLQLLQSPPSRSIASQEAQFVRQAGTPACLEPPPYLGFTWWDHVTLRWGVIRFYLHTVWRALKGDDPYDLD